jgi:hypothetical protein
MAARAEHQNPAHTLLYESLPQFSEPALKKIRSAKIMRGFGAATENYTQRGDALAEMLEQFQETGRTGSGKGAAGKKHGIALFAATFRQSKQGITICNTTLFIGKESFMLGKGSSPACHDLLPHFQKHGCRIKPDLGRTNCCAQTAEIAGKGKLPPEFRVRLPGGGNGLRGTVLLQKSALADTATAVKAVFCMEPELEYSGGSGHLALRQVRFRMKYFRTGYFSYCVGSCPQASARRPMSESVGPGPG